MPASIKLQEEHADDLQVIFVESQGASRDKAAAFALRQKWFGTNAMWTDERPTKSPGRGLPAFVLLGNDGQILLSGNPLAQKGAIEDAIAAQLKLAKSAPQGTPSKLKKAWSELGKGNLAKALTAAEKVALNADDDDLLEAAESAIEVFTQRAESRLSRARAMMETGDYTFAEEQLDELTKSVKGHAALETRVAEARASLESDDLTVEREAAAALAKIERKMAGKGGPAKQLSSLEKLAEKYPDTKAGARAGRYVQLIEMKL